MKKYNPFYYLLFILLVMGTFASMAQNSYGLQIIGCVAFSFGLIFLVQLLGAARHADKMDTMDRTETACLFFLAVILGMRVFYIHFPMVEWIFSGAGILLGYIYLRRMQRRYKDLQSKNRLLSIFILLFHSSLVLFIVSLLLAPFIPEISSVAGITAFLLLLIFIVAGWLRREMIVDGESLSAFIVVKKFKDHSIVIATLFILFSLYAGLNKAGLLPGIYADEFPQAYYKLVDDALSGREKSENGQYRYQAFEAKYDQFIQRNGPGK